MAKTGFVRVENMGTKLSIDEINIGGDVYTILGNPEKNVIVACIPGTKAAPIVAVISKEISYTQRLAVTEVTLDMSSSMDWIITELFPQAKKTLDRFHVTKNVLEDIQCIRMREKTRIKEEELSIEEQCKIERKRYIPKRYTNDETRLTFITKLRYQLFERRKDWSDYQKARWNILQQHTEYDEIRVSYEVLENFYEIYGSEISREQAKPLWEEWFKQVSKYDSIKELQNS